jgi:hypothetical protein
MKHLSSFKIHLRIGLFLSSFLLMSCQLFALPAVMQSTPPAETFMLQNGKLVEWRKDAYHPVPMDDVDPQKVFLAVEDSQPVMKMRLQWELIEDDNATIYKSGDLTIGKYVNGSWQIIPFTFTVVPESIKAAQEQYSVYDQQEKEVFQKKIENDEDKFYYLTIPSSFPVGMKYDREKRQLIFLLSHPDGFLLVRPQVITLQILHNDQSDANDRVAIQNQELSLAGIVKILEKLQFTRMTYAPDAKARSFYYIIDISSKGPKISSDYFAKNLSSVYYDQKYYPQHIGDFSSTYFQQLVQDDRSSYTIETFQNQWRWIAIDKITSGQDPWLENELSFPGASIELFLIDKQSD